MVLVSMGTILTSDTSDVGWHSVPRDGSERPRGLSGKQLCQSAWSAAFEALGSSEPAAPLLLVAIGSQADALEGLEVPKNACCHSYLPQVEVLKAGVDVFLTHGGQNSFMEALMADVPVVVCPGFADQIANGQRAVQVGVGLQVPRPKPPHGEELRAMAAYRGEVSNALQRLLAEPHFGKRAQQIGEELRRQGGVARALELLLGLVERPMLLGHDGVRLKQGKQVALA